MAVTRRRVSKISKSRIQNMVRSLMEHEKREIRTYPLPAAELIFKSKNSIWIRGMWTVIILSCILMTVYQTYDRCKHYLSYPVMVDVHFSNEKFREFPEVTFCIGETKEVVQFFKYVYEYTKRPFDQSCDEIVICFVHYANRMKITVSQLWKAMNTTTLLQSVELQHSKSVKASIRETDSLFGRCTTVRFDEKVPTNDILVVNFTNAMPYWIRALFGRIHNGIFINEVGTLPTTTRYIWKRTSKSHHFRLVSKQYSFLKRPGFPCVDEDTFDACIQKCFADEILIKNVTCRWPYYPNVGILSTFPDCVLSTWELWKDYKRMYDYRIQHSKCECTRKCEERVFEDTATYELTSEEASIFTFAFGDAGETIITEKLSYDIILLLCDIGGNCGLFTGLSLLSLVELAGIACLKRKRYREEFKLQDPIFRKVVRQYQAARSHHLIARKVLLSHQKVLLWVKKILTTCCMIFCVYAVSYKLLYFLSYPITVVVEIIYNQTVTLPNIAGCRRDSSFNAKKRDYGMAQGIYPCNVSYTDLVGFNDMRAEDFWPKANPQEELPVRYGGVCIYKKLGVRYTRRYFWTTIRDVDAFCGDEIKPLFYYPPDESLDIYQYVDIPNSFLPITVFNVKELRLDKLPAACSSSEIVLKCRQDCFQKRLFSRLSCSLPYMPISNLTRCRSSLDARQADATYLDVNAAVRYPEECNCPPKCVTTIYEVRLSMEPYILPNSYKAGIRISSVSNVIESYSKVLTYPVEKLISDIGGYVGFILGWCVVSMFRDIFYALQKLYGTCYAYLMHVIKFRAY